MITALMRLLQRDARLVRRQNHHVWFGVVGLARALDCKSQSPGETQGHEWPVVYIAAPQLPATLEQHCSGWSCRLAAISA